MKKIILLTTILTLLISVNSFAADESFDATITIRSAITIDEDLTLRFGDLETTGAIQTVTVATGDAGAAQFDITGDVGVAVTWSVVEATINMTGAGDDIVVNAFTVSGGGTGNLPQVDVTVGATANVNANQAAGIYTGSATFNAVYN
ncbi:MAG: DUF4402 domain-containing protein [Desulfobacterales bacterium]|nr:DUF4402 domain-containing protein [Desulfobacterales bacterium]